MVTRYDLARRLEPIRPDADLQRGFEAEVADPVWFLGRQWQMGEHRGEDAGSPVAVSVRASHDPIDPYGGDPSLDPRVVPAEAILESGPDDWWTPARRVRIGLAAGPSVPAARADDPDLQLPPLAPPYDGIQGFDGRSLYEARVELGLPDAPFDVVPTRTAPDLWDYAELVHTAEMTCGGTTLRLPRHDGGDVDWFSVSADHPLPAPVTAPGPVHLTPGRLKYPGAPHPRWWQIENARVDVGGYPPDRSHFATTLLLDLVVSHSDDWFTFPIDTRTGSVVTLHEVQVTDSFGITTALTTTGAWGMFHVHGLEATSLVVWPTAAAPLTGAVLDDVVVGVDEDANLLWAIERRAAGRELAPPLATAPPPAPSGEIVGNARMRYSYRPSTTLPRYWHPYLIADVDGRRRFVQGRLADVDQRPPTLMPEPVSPLLADPRASATDPVHQIEPATVPTTGLRLERRWVLGRCTDGRPVLWMQRRRLPLLAPPVSGLRFDVAEESPTTTGPP